jgi:F-type H+-transporting ATPase subunit gamma
MSNLNETKAAIDSITGTQKITRAMYLMAASKSKKARRQYEQSLPYFNQVAVTLSEILAETEPFASPYINGFDNARNNGKLFLVISADRGLSGGYLHNIIELMEHTVDRTKDLCFIAGHTGRSRITAKRFPADRDFIYPVTDPGLNMTREIGARLIQAFNSGKYASVQMIFSEMVNAMTVVPKAVQLLPLKPEDLSGRYVPNNRVSVSSAVFEPSVEAVFDCLTPSFIKGVVYGAFVDSYISEQNARMMAMDNSTRNAEDMLARLTLKYNRVRQAGITQEINEIVGAIPAQ